MSDNVLGDALYEQSAATVFHLAKKIIGGAIRGTRDENQIQRATLSYLDAFLQRHGMVKVLAMSKPVPLRDIYTDVRCVGADFLARFASIEELEKSFRGTSRELFSVPIEIQRDGIVAANEHKYLSVLGAPGAGKTTFLRRLGLEALLPRRTWRRFIPGMTPVTPDELGWSRYEPSCLPVFVELRRFRWESVDLFGLLATEFEICGFPAASHFLSRGLRKGRFLVLLDGIDEVPRDKEAVVVAHLRDFMDRFPRNRYVISCRTAFYRSFFPRFRDVVLTDLSDYSIHDAVRRWFGSGGAHAAAGETLWAVLASHAPTRELARTPLLLTFICVVYEATQKLPANRSTLYRKALDILLERWAAEKQVHNERIYAELASDVEIELLSELALDAIKRDAVFFERSYLVDFIRRYMMNELKAPRGLGYDQILEAVEVQQGILVARAADVYSFSHLTIQEYLAAYQIHNSGAGERCVAEHVMHERWREVILLLAGMAKADRLLRAGVGALNSLADSGLLAAMLEWVGRSAGSTRSRIARLHTLMSIQFVLAAIPPDTAAEVTETFDVAFSRLRALATALSVVDVTSGDLLQLPREVTGRWEGYSVEYAFQAVQRTRGVLSAAVRSGIAFNFDFAILDQIAARLPVRAEHSEVRSAIGGSMAMLAKKIAAAVDSPEDIISISPDDLTRLNEYLHAATVLADFKQSALRLSPHLWDMFAGSVLRQAIDV